MARPSLKREVIGYNLGPVKTDTVLPTVRHCSYISSLTRKWARPINTFRRNWANNRGQREILILIVFLVQIHVNALQSVLKL